MNINEQALAECDAEPVHISGFVQQNGILHGFDRLRFAEVLMVSTGDRALNLLKRSRIQIAVLYMHSGSETSFPIARELVRLSIPVLFAIGCGLDIGPPPGLEDLPLVTKPAELSNPTDVISGLLAVDSKERSA